MTHLTVSRHEIMYALNKSIIRSSTQLGHQSLTPLRFDSVNREVLTLFEVVIYAEQVRYQYGFRLTADRIYDEWLLPQSFDFALSAKRF
ncbi:hypothetical protein D5085_04270 [Ectothiorhodospiraceae bacterium BW-2]|nr:hypothetical protein D5085_04270 [Ectothiorhodospiraceae bacterium BW-2]